jgi:hypothetical protein
VLLNTSPLHGSINKKAGMDSPTHGFSFVPLIAKGFQLIDDAIFSEI